MFCRTTRLVAISPDVKGARIPVLLCIASNTDRPANAVYHPYIHTSIDLISVGISWSLDNRGSMYKRMVLRRDWDQATEHGAR